MPSFKVQVYHSRAVADLFYVAESFTVTRQDVRENDPPPIALHSGGRGLRLIIAGLESVGIPRNWFEVRLTDGAEFTVVNTHASVSLPISHESELRPGEARSFEREVLLDLGLDIAVRIEPEIEAARSDSAFRSLGSIPQVPGEDPYVTHVAPLGRLPAGEADVMLKMLRLALQVVQKAAGSDAFYQSAVVATTEIVNLDRSLILLRNTVDQASNSRGGSSELADWRCVASHSKTGEKVEKHLASRSLLNRVLAQCTTVVHDPMKAAIDSAGSDPMPMSLRNVECAVASPILNSRREVVGVLYGDRRITNLASPLGAIDDVDATLVEILAGSIAGGIARCSEERLRHTLSEFFSPKVASRLATNPELMAGYDAEVSVLFCDIRGFSTVTEELGPQKAIAWINDVMSELSECVLERDGVLVDYVGDELLAMWGAPGEQPDHALRAVQSARAMLGKIEVLRERWNDVLPQRFGAGIGINTGKARVGNVGSRQKFKYGPLGNTVNLGSRLQSATKQLGVDCVISQTTAVAAGCLTDSRRVARLRVAGIEGPVDVYQIVKEPSEAWIELATDYQLALKDYEEQLFRDAARRLGSLLPRFPDDRLCRKLLARSVAELDEPSKDFTGIWELTNK